MVKTFIGFKIFYTKLYSWIRCGRTYTVNYRNIKEIHADSVKFYQLLFNSYPKQESKKSKDWTKGEIRTGKIQLAWSVSYAIGKRIM